MKITLAMIEAARLAEFEYHRRHWLGLGRHTPTPDVVIKVMLEAAFAHIPDEVAATVKPAAIVTSRKPRPRR